MHAAILNDPAAMAADRRAAWDAYVGATRNLVDAANAAGAQIVLVSTDWVFDGTQGPAPEDAPPNPVNQYGFLKAASELVVRERAERGTVARSRASRACTRRGPARAARGRTTASATSSPRWSMRCAPARPFRVWESDAINMLATPTLATDAGELIWRALRARGRRRAALLRRRARRPR